MRLPIEQDFGHQFAGNGAVHEAVSRKTGQDVEALHGGAAKDGVRVGGDLVQAGYPADHAGALQQGQAGYGRFHVRQFPVGVYELVESGRFVGVGHTGQQAVAFTVKIQRFGKVYHKWEVLWNLRQRGGGQPLAAQGRDGDVHAGHLTDAPCPGAGGVDDLPAGDCAPVGVDAPDAASLYFQAGHFGGGLGAYPQALGSLQVSLHHPVGVHQPIFGVEGAPQGVLEAHLGQAFADFVPIQPFGHHPQGVLQGDVVFEDLDIPFLGEDEQVAALAVFHRVADFLLEALQHGQTFQREADVDLGGELVTHTARTPAGGSCAEKFFFFQQQDIVQAAGGQVIGGAYAHHSPSNDDGIGCSVHGGKFTSDMSAWVQAGVGRLILACFSAPVALPGHPVRLCPRI